MLKTRNDLKASIENYLDRGDVDIDELIQLAEVRHERDIRFREMLTTATATVTRQLSLPEDFLEMRTIRVLTDPVTVLQEVSNRELGRLRQSTAGRPRYFALHAFIEFERDPDKDYTAEMLYYRRLAPLTSANQSNPLLERAPDAYLYGALVAAEPFLMNDERVPLWEKFYTSARDRLNEMDRTIAGPIVSQVYGDTP